MKIEQIKKEVETYIQAAKEDNTHLRVRYLLDSKGVWGVEWLLMINKLDDDFDEHYKYSLRKKVGNYKYIPYFNFHVEPDSSLLLNMSINTYS